MNCISLILAATFQHSKNWTCDRTQVSIFMHLCANATLDGNDSLIPGVFMVCVASRLPAAESEGGASHRPTRSSHA